MAAEAQLEESAKAEQAAAKVPEPEQPADDDDVDSEAGDSLITFDYAAIEEAQRIAANLDEAGAVDDEEARKRKQRGGCKESQKKRKRQRREDDVIRAKQAGLPVPSLKELLAANAATSSSSSSSAVPGASASPVVAAASSSSVEASAAPAAVAAAALATGSGPAPASVAAGVAAEAAPSPAAEAAAKRLTREAARRSKIAKALDARTVFVTNLPFKVSEQEVSDWMSTCGKVKHVRLSKDKGTSKPLGYGHVQFESSESVAVAIEKCDRFDVQGRVVRVCRVGKGESLKFDLPEELKADIVALVREGSVDNKGTTIKSYEGMNISTIKDAWQKRHSGQKLDTSKYGFKNFSTAMQTIEGLTLEHHVEKNLTFLAFLTDSSAHRAYIQERSLRQAEREKAGHLQLSYGANGRLNLTYHKVQAAPPAEVSAPTEEGQTSAARKRPLEESSDAKDSAEKKRCVDAPVDERSKCDIGHDQAVSVASGEVPQGDAVMT